MQKYFKIQIELHRLCGDQPTTGVGVVYRHRELISENDTAISFINETILFN